MKALKFNSPNKQSPLKLSLLLQKAYLGNWYESVRQDENWMRFRKKVDEEQFDVYIKWINLQFSRILYDKNAEALEEAKHLYSWLRVTNLRQDLEDGLRFLYLVEIIYKTILKKEFGSKKLGCLKLHKIKNHDTCLNYLQNKARLKCVGINALDLADGNLKMLTGLLFLLKHDFESRIFNKDFIEYSQSQLTNLRSSSAIFQEKRLSSKSYSHILEAEENKKDHMKFCSVSDIDHDSLENNKYPHIQHIIDAMILDNPHKEPINYSHKEAKSPVCNISPNGIRSDSSLAKKCSEHERLYVSHVQQMAISVVDPNCHVIKQYNDTFDPVEKSISGEDFLDRNVVQESKVQTIDNSLTIYAETSQNKKNSTEEKRNNKKQKNKLIESSRIHTQIIIESETETSPANPHNFLENHTDIFEPEKEQLKFPIISEIKAEILKEMSDSSDPSELNYPEINTIKHEFTEDIDETNEDSGNEIDYSSKVTKELLSQYIRSGGSLNDLSVEEIISNNLNLNEKLKEKVYKSLESVKNEPAYIEQEHKTSNHFTELIDNENFIVKNNIMNDGLVNDYSYSDSANEVSSWSFDESVAKKNGSGNTNNSKRSSLNDATDTCFNNSDNSDSELNNRASYILNESIKMIEDSDESRSSLSTSDVSPTNYQDADFIQFNDLNNDLDLDEHSYEYHGSGDTNLIDNENYLVSEELIKDELIKDYSYTDSTEDYCELNKEIDTDETPLSLEVVTTNKVAYNESEIPQEESLNTQFDMESITANENYFIEQDVINDSYINDYDYLNTANNELDNTIQNVSNGSKENGELFLNLNEVDKAQNLFTEESIAQNENIRQNSSEDNKMESPIEKEFPDSSDSNEIIKKEFSDSSDSNDIIKKEFSDSSNSNEINEQKEMNFSDQSQLNEDLEEVSETLNKKDFPVNIIESDNRQVLLNESIIPEDLENMEEAILEEPEDIFVNNENSIKDQIGEKNENEHTTFEKAISNSDVPTINESEIKSNHHEDINISDVSEINKTNEILPTNISEGSKKTENTTTKLGRRNKRVRKRKPSYLEQTNIECTNECAVEIVKSENITELSSNEKHIDCEIPVAVEEPKLIDEIDPSISTNNSDLSKKENFEEKNDILVEPRLEQPVSELSEEIPSIISEEETTIHEFSNSNETVDREVNIVEGTVSIFTKKKSNKTFRKKKKNYAKKTMGHVDLTNPKRTNEITDLNVIKSETVGIENKKESIDNNSSIGQDITENKPVELENQRESFNNYISLDQNITENKPVEFSNDPTNSIGHKVIQNIETCQDSIDNTINNNESKNEDTKASEPNKIKGKTFFLIKIFY